MSKVNLLFCNYLCIKYLRPFLRRESVMIHYQVLTHPALQGHTKELMEGFGEMLDSPDPMEFISKMMVLNAYQLTKIVP